MPGHVAEVAIVPEALVVEVEEVEVEDEPVPSEPGIARAPQTLPAMRTSLETTFFM